MTNQEKESGKALGRRVLLQYLQQRVAIGEKVACVTLLEHWDSLGKRSRTFF